MKGEVIMKQKEFDIHTIHSFGANRPLTPEELKTYIVKYDRKKCTLCESGQMLKKPLNVSVKNIDENNYVIVETFDKGRMDAVRKTDLNYLWACNKCNNAEPQWMKNDKE